MAGLPRAPLADSLCPGLCCSTTLWLTGWLREDARRSVQTVLIRLDKAAGYASVELLEAVRFGSSAWREASASKQPENMSGERLRLRMVAGGLPLFFDILNGVRGAWCGAQGTRALPFGTEIPYHWNQMAMATRFW